MIERELIWVEIELCVGHSVTSYNGQMYLEDYTRIERGFIEMPFIKLMNVHWYELPDDDKEGWKKKKLIEYGAGNHSEYDTEALLKAENIVTIFRLKHGPRLENPFSE